MIAAPMPDRRRENEARYKAAGLKQIRIWIKPENEAAIRAEWERKPEPLKPGRKPKDDA